MDHYRDVNGKGFYFVQFYTYNYNVYGTDTGAVMRDRSQYVRKRDTSCAGQMRVKDDEIIYALDFFFNKTILRAFFVFYLH